MVATALTVDGVAAVARIPLEAVGSEPQRCLVRADVAVDEVVAGAADEGLGPGAADQRVVAAAAVHGHVLVRERTAALVDADVVVAAAGLDVDGGEGRPVEAELCAAVSADVRLERAGRARREAERELVARRVAAQRQCSRLDARRVGRLGQVGGEAEDSGGDGADQKDPAGGRDAVHRRVLSSLGEGGRASCAG